MYYQIEPEIAGGWGEKTIADTRCHPPIVTMLEYEFDGWLGDSLLTSFPCYIITQKLATDLQQANLSGFTLTHCEVTTSATFNELTPKEELPEFQWLKVNGVAGKDDFGMNENHLLVVSTRALKLITSHQLKHCDIEEYSA